MIRSQIWMQIKKPITIYLIIAISLLILINMVSVEAKRENRNFPGHDSNLNSSQMSDFSRTFLKADKEKEKYPVALSSLDFFDQISYETTQATLIGDSKETIRLNILSELMILKLIRDSNVLIERANLKQDIYEIWDHVSNGVSYDSIDFRPISLESGIEAQLLLEVRYWDELYQNNIEPIYDDEANNITVWYSFLYSVGPLLFILVPILVTYASINSDKNSGVLKLLLTQSVSRKKYYFSKWIVSVIQSFLVIVIPSLIMGLFYGLKNGFVSLIYPVTYLSNIWTRLRPIPNYIENIFPDGKQTALGRSTFMHMAPSNPYEDIFIQPHQGVDLIPFYQYILIGLIILILYVSLITALVQLMSAIFNNGVVSLAASAVIIGSGIGLTHFMTIGEHYNVMPLSFFKIGRIIEGTQNVTVLGAVLMLLLSIGLLLFGGVKYFDRKVI